MSSLTSPDRQIHRRISKACEPCRRRKTKCDGAQPICDQCKKLADPRSCNYRLKPRIRPSRTVDTADHNPLPRGGGLSTDQASRHDDHLRREDSSIRAPSVQETGDDVQQGVLEAQSQSTLYYGPSSNFAFLQHIHQSFKEPDVRGPTAQHDHSGSLDRYKHRERFFASDHFVRSGVETAKGRFLLLPEKLARQFLHSFLQSLQHLVPFLRSHELVQGLDGLYDPSSAKTLVNSQTAIILLTLAHGATQTEHSQWVEQLVERAKAEMPSLEHTVNLDSVQVSLLLGLIQANCGRPNSAYLHLGMAARKAFALGLHRDIDYRGFQGDDVERSERRRLVLWSLVVYERWVSFWLGRPSALDSSPISVPVPQTSPLVRSLAELSDIIVEITQRLYQDTHLAPEKLWESAQHIRLKLYGFQKRSELLLGFDLDGTVLLSNRDIDQLFVTNLFHHVWMLTFRPFLIMHMSWLQHRGLVDTSAHQRAISLPVDMWWLPEACGVAVEHAHTTIKFFAAILESMPVVKGLVFSAAYLETACCLLFYDSIRDRSSIDNNESSIRTSLLSLQQMLKTGPVPGVISTVEQMLLELEQIKQTGRPSLSRGPSQSMLSASSNPANNTQQAMQAQDTAIGAQFTAAARDQDSFLAGDIPLDSGLFEQGWPYNFWGISSTAFDRGVFAPDLITFFGHDASEAVTT